MRLSTLPYQPDRGQDAPEQERLTFGTSREVRHTVIRVVAAHLGVFDGAEFTGGTVRFDRAVFSGSTLRFDGAAFSGSTVLFGGARFSGGAADFSFARFSGGPVIFVGEPFPGRPPDGTVLIDKVGSGDAKFSSGEVYFSRPSTGHPTRIPWTDTPPPGVRLPRKDDQSQAQAGLPDSWPGLALLR